MSTFIATARLAAESNRWHIIDADGQVLGRIATRAARLLQGKHKPIYTPFLDTGDHVVIVNAAKVKLTGRKEDQKIYRQHSGYEGGLREDQRLSNLSAKGFGGEEGVECPIVHADAPGAGAEENAGGGGFPAPGSVVLNGCHVTRPRV